MNKELEAFNNILKMSVGLYKEDVEVVETALKALEIIKEKQVNVALLNVAKNLKEYNRFPSVIIAIEQEEYDLLKEVLK